MRSRRTVQVLMAMSVAVALLVTGCSGASSDNGAAGDKTAGLTTVRIGVTPYYEYQWWTIAKSLGLDKEQGLDFKLVTNTTAGQSITTAFRGDVDIASTCHACNMPLLKSTPTMRDWIITNQFKGFILVGRNGKTDTFEELSKTMSDEQTKEQILNSFKGKTFDVVASERKALLTSALQQVGMSIDDIKMLNFSDDSQAALAFAGGTGDFYIGSLPEEAKFLADPEKYVNVGGLEVLGDAALWFSTMVSTDKWLKDNEKTALKTLAVWYRVMEYLNKAPEKVIPEYTKVMNKVTASSFSQGEIEDVLSKLELFATLKQAGTEFYTPSSPTYYMKSVKHYIEDNKSVLPADYAADKYILDEVYYKKLMADTKLVEWVNSPTK